MGVWEGFPNDGQELLAYVGLYIFTERRVEPCNFSIVELRSRSGDGQVKVR